MARRRRWGGGPHAVGRGWAEAGSGRLRRFCGGCAARVLHCRLAVITAPGRVLHAGHPQEWKQTWVRFCKVNKVCCWKVNFTAAGVECWQDIPGPALRCLPLPLVRSLPSRRRAGDSPPYLALGMRRPSAGRAGLSQAAAAQRWVLAPVGGQDSAAARHRSHTHLPHDGGLGQPCLPPRAGRAKTLRRVSLLPHSF